MLVLKQSQKVRKADVETLLKKLMNNSDFGKTMENIWKHRTINFVNNDSRRNYLVPEPSYYSTK